MSSASLSSADPYTVSLTFSPKSIKRRKIPPPVCCCCWGLLSEATIAGDDVGVGCGCCCCFCCCCDNKPLRLVVCGCCGLKSTTDEPGLGGSEPSSFASRAACLFDLELCLKTSLPDLNNGMRGWFSKESRSELLLFLLCRLLTASLLGDPVAGGIKVFIISFPIVVRLSAAL